MNTVLVMPTSDEALDLADMFADVVESTNSDVATTMGAAVSFLVATARASGAEPEDVLQMVRDYLGAHQN